MVDEPRIVLIGSPGAGKTTAAKYLRKWFSPIHVIDGLDSEQDYWDAKATGHVIVRVAAEQAARAERTRNPEIGECLLAGLAHDYLVFNQGTRDVLYNQLIEVMYKEVAKF